MRITFKATEAGFEVDEWAIICQVSAADRWLTFQREGKGSSEDWGIHLEYTGQANSGYDCIRECRLSRAQLSADLSRAIDTLPGVNGFDIDLAIDDDCFAELKTGLEQVFRDKPGLVVTE